ncbi:hypothetical protein BDW71DRAFT_181315 [Aspergillus fruticulosus]
MRSLSGTFDSQRLCFPLCICALVCFQLLPLSTKASAATLLVNHGLGFEKLCNHYHRRMKSVFFRRTITTNSRQQAHFSASNATGNLFSHSK